MSDDYRYCFFLYFREDEHYRFNVLSWKYMLGGNLSVADIHLFLPSIFSILTE